MGIKIYSYEDENDYAIKQLNNKTNVLSDYVSIYSTFHDLNKFDIIYSDQCNEIHHCRYKDRHTKSMINKTNAIQFTLYYYSISSLYHSVSVLYINNFAQ